MKDERFVITIICILVILFIGEPDLHDVLVQYFGGYACD